MSKWALSERLEYFKEKKAELQTQFEDVNCRIKWEMAETQYPDYEWIASRATEAAALQSQLKMLGAVIKDLESVTEV